MRATLLKSCLLFNFTHLARAIWRSFAQSTWDPANWMRRQQPKSLIWDHKTPRHSQSNHGRCRWIFHKKAPAIRMGDWELCSMWCWLVLHIPASLDNTQRRKTGERTERERGREGWHVGSFWVSLSWCETNVKLWQKCDRYLQCQKTSRLAHILICQVR